MIGNDGQSRREALYGAPPAPYLPLRDAVGPPDATFMLPRIASYQQYHREEFVAEMSGAIAEAQASLGALVARGAVVPDDLRNVLTAIASRRREIAFRVGEKDAGLFGKPPERRTIDLLPADREHRHYPFRDRALAALGRKWQRVATLNGYADPAYVEERGEDLVVVHPPPDVSADLAETALAFLAVLFVAPELPEGAFAERLARATYLLMHGTPFVRGTPACVQAFNDALARTLRRKTFPPFAIGVEPFWEAILESSDTFVAYYRSYFDP